MPTRDERIAAREARQAARAARHAGRGREPGDAVPIQATDEPELHTAARSRPAREGEGPGDTVTEPAERRRLTRGGAYTSLVALAERLELPAEHVGRTVSACDPVLLSVLDELAEMHLHLLRIGAREHGGEEG